LQNRQNVSRRILEPRDLWSGVSTEDASLVGLDVGHVVMFELHAESFKLIDGPFDIVYGKIENRE
jgi:hypothetical protein